MRISLTGLLANARDELRTAARREAVASYREAGDPIEYADLPADFEGMTAYGIGELYRNLLELRRRGDEAALREFFELYVVEEP